MSYKEFTDYGEIMIIERRVRSYPVYALQDMSISDASELMKKNHLHRLPVITDGKLVGIIAEKDILRATPSPASTLSAYEVNYLTSKLKVRDIMSKNPVCISKNTTVEEAAALMVKQDLSCLPVMEDDKLVGIVSKTDMFKILLELFGAGSFGVRIEFLVENKSGKIAEITHAIAKKGYDIISFGTFSGTEPDNAICTVKLRNCSKSDVLDVIKPFVLEILDVREV